MRLGEAALFEAVHEGEGVEVVDVGWGLEMGVFVLVGGFQLQDAFERFLDSVGGGFHLLFGVGL